MRSSSARRPAIFLDLEWRGDVVRYRPTECLWQPGELQYRHGLRCPRPSAPEGIGNLGNFIYVGTATGQIYVTQDGGGSGTSNNWINISTGLGRLAGRVDHHEPAPRQSRSLRRDPEGRVRYCRFGSLGD